MVKERLVERRRRRRTGTTVEVWRGFDGQPDWQTVCVEHGGICLHYTLADAMAFARDPAEWCPGCRVSD